MQIQLKDLSLAEMMAFLSSVSITQDARFDLSATGVAFPTKPVAKSEPKQTSESKPAPKQEPKPESKPKTPPAETNGSADKNIAPPSTPDRPEGAPSDSQPDLAKQARDALMKVARQNSKRAIGILREFGAGGFAEVTPEKYGDLISRCALENA